MTRFIPQLITVAWQSNIIPVLVLFAVFFFCLFRYKPQPKADSPLPKESPDNMDLQSAYLVKHIRLAKGEDEFKYWRTRINEFAAQFLDHPDIHSEVKELRDYLNECEAEDKRLRVRKVGIK